MAERAIEVWVRTWCVYCEQVNWLYETRNEATPDLEGFVCHSCLKAQALDEAEPGNPSDYDFYVGLRSPI